MVLINMADMQTVDFVVQELKKVPYKVAGLHGSCTQVQRDATMLAFKAGKVQVLVATDVAARGLHVRNLPYIVNYDFPGNMETYVHRAGRTGALSISRDGLPCNDLITKI